MNGEGRVHRAVRVLLFLTSFSWTFNPIQDYMGEGTPLEKIATRMVPMLIVGAYCLFCRHRDRLRTMFRPGLWALLWYVAFGVFCGISSVQPALCAWKGAEILIAVMFFCVSCRDAQTTRHELESFVTLYEILLWATVALAIVNPSLGLRRSASVIPWLQGYLPILNPNALGFLAVLCVAKLLFLPARWKPVRLMMAAGVLVCSQSRTSYVVMIAVLVIYMIDGFRARQYGRMVLTFFFAFLALACIANWHEAILRVVMRGQTAEEMGSLSGRTDYWAFAMDNVSWIGSGLATGSRSLIFIGESTFHKGSVNMHNSFVEALVGAGYIGAVPFLAMIVINTLRQGVRTIVRPSLEEALFLVVAITFIARGMTSIVFALFSCDFNNMMIFWAWLYARDARTVPAVDAPPPRPVVYERTLAEQRMAQDAAPHG